MRSGEDRVRDRGGDRRGRVVPYGDGRGRRLLDLDFGYGYGYDGGCVVHRRALEGAQSKVQTVAYRLEKILLVSARCVPPSFTLVPPMSDPYEVYLFPDKKKLCIIIFLLLISVILVDLVAVMKV